MPDKDLQAEVKTLFGKPPENVVDYFRKKVPVGPKSHWDWSDTMQHAHDRAFVVAKATSLDLVKDIQEALKSSIADGMPYQDFANNIIPTLKEKGWWGKGEQLNKETGQVSDVEIDHRRLRNIYDTNVKSAYAAGHYETMTAKAEDAPYWRYVAKPNGPTRRPEHQKLHNLVFRYDDPFWQTHYAPNGWGCECRVEALDKRALERKYRRPVDDVVRESRPDDYVTQTVTVQGKRVNVTGYRVGNSVVYTSPGWDYAPGSYSLQYQQMLESKIADMPEEAARKTLRGQLEGSLKDSFKLIVDTEAGLHRPNGSSFAVGMLPEKIVKILNTKKDRAGRQLDLDTSILGVEDRQLLHALRPDHNGAPKEIIADIPELLDRWTPTYTPEEGLVYYSEPFDGEMQTAKKMEKKKVRYKIVFNQENPKSDKMVFKTATIVGAQALDPKSIIK
ncbi:MAG: phage minor head protein [Sphaerochaetaceae bacterium]